MDLKSIHRKLEEIIKKQDIFDKNLNVLEEIQLNFSKMDGRLQAVEEEMKMIREKIQQNTKVTIESAQDIKDTIEGGEN